MLKVIFTTILCLQFIQAQVIERKVVPAHIKEKAHAAVKILANEVMKDNFLYSLENMYPRWKESTAKEIGGMEELKKRLEAVPRDMKAQGISIIDFQVGRATSSFEVNSALYSDLKKAPEFSEYLVILPTTTFYRAVDPKGGTIKKLKIQSFQVAICSKKNEKWSFIDGGSLTIRQLRSLFPNLPQQEETLKLPERTMEEL